MEPKAVSGVGIVQPFVPNVPGTIFVPFFYFIISIFIIATIHEFSHGMIARVHNIKLKSSGFAFLGIILPIIPAAFVEPDEKELMKRPIRQQLSVFAAGPFSNILLAFAILGIFLVALAPVVEAIIDFDGIRVVKLEENYPAQQAGIELDEIIHEIDGLLLTDLSNFSSTLKQYSPGDEITVKTDKQDYQIVLAKNPSNESLAFIGLSAKPAIKTKPAFEAKYGTFLSNAILWFIGLLYWLFLLNFGIGLFNLIPLGPIDGGRMFKAALSRFFDEKKAVKIWGYTSFFILSALILNIALSIFG